MIKFDINELNIQEPTSLVIARLNNGNLELMSTDYYNGYMISSISEFGDYILLQNNNMNSQDLPEKFGIKSCYPNPFNPSTTINYFVDYESEIYITVYNLLGEKVRELENSLKTPGTYSIQWDGINDFNEKVATGIYFIELKNANLKDVRKVTFIK